ncbi:hypothetical protein [Roseinatronobacter alkalisoli]|uniref:Uncharacterized protein n=1 Tax=Roseinatronobacter alkalisoli TaxID=3028235 RepID=A0ABT5TGI7_9RHOB|nr:hypothetical protein [Roseinatronobacter sp. HJB301]MDD7973805.1 hypothetical protein [Roseinatronobacter sp. HJB301]
MSKLTTIFAGFILLLIGGYLYVAPPFMAQDGASYIAHSGPRGLLGLTCPPDIYADDYLAYLERADAAMDMRLEPQIFGTQGNLRTLTAVFESSEHPLTGISLSMTSAPFEKIWSGICEGRCGTRQYQRLARTCAEELGGQCLDFAIVIDGVAQCLMTPKPEVGQ